MPFLGKTPAQIVDPEVDIDGGSIDGATIGATSASAATVTTFTSTGIDDNATSTAIAINADGTVDFNHRVDIEGTISGSYLVCDDGTNGRFQINPTSASEVSFYGASTGFSGWGSLNFKGTHHIMTYGPGAGTELARFDLDGLKFNGDTAAANALDDYEEGAWTAHVRDSHDGSIRVNTESPSNYIKIGRQVVVWIRVYAQGVSAHNFVGTPYIELPFDPSNDTGGQVTYSPFYNVGMGSIVSGYAFETTTFYLATNATNPFGAPATGFSMASGNKRFYGMAVYTAAS